MLGAPALEWRTMRIREARQRPRNQILAECTVLQRSYRGGGLQSLECSESCITHYATRRQRVHWKDLGSDLVKEVLYWLERLPTVFLRLLHGNHSRLNVSLPVRMVPLPQTIERLSHPWRHRSVTKDLLRRAIEDKLSRLPQSTQEPATDTVRARLVGADKRLGERRLCKESTMQNLMDNRANLVRAEILIALTIGFEPKD